MKLFFTTLFLSAIMIFPVFSERVESYARKGSNVTLDLGWTGENYGTIQWQKSTDGGATWEDISNATRSTYTFQIQNPTHIRAVVNGDPSCPELIVERYITPVQISSEVLSQYADHVEMEVDITDFKNLPVEEYGYTFTSIGRNYDVLPLNKVGDTLPEGNVISMTCTGLKPNVSYSIRPYVKTKDGSVIYGGGKVARTIAGITWSNEGWTIDKDGISACLQSSGNPTIKDMTFQLGADENSLKSYAVNARDNGLYVTQKANGLKPGTTYMARFTANVDGEDIVLTREVKTMSDYSGFVKDETVKPVSHEVVWDNTVVREFSPSGLQVEYPRMCRVNDQKILLTYHGAESTLSSDHWQDSYLRKSYDNGKTWSTPVKLFDHSKQFLGSGYWRICNPEMTRLENGWIILSVVANGNPETNYNCKVMLSISKDDGETWSEPLVVGRGRTWEPQVVQLPNGEVELLVSSEEKWYGVQNNLYQEIVVSRSTDNGETWTEFKRAAYVHGARDGMPVSVVMQGNKGVMFCIETVNGNCPISLVHRDLDKEWETIDWDRKEDSERWYTNLNNGAGAPNMIQLPTGEFLIMGHTNPTGGPWQTCRPQTVLADNTGHDFKYKRLPMHNCPELGGSTGAYYNSFFLYDEETVWLLMTKAKYTGDHRDNSAIIMIEGKIVER